jgi:signal transduction histidine kinase
MIQKNTARLRSQVTDLLSLFRYKGKNMLLDMEVIDLGDLCDAAVRDMSNLISNRGLRCLISKKSDNLKIKCDGKKIGQVVANLLSNAIKFSSESEIQINIESRDTELVFSIVDHGHGIAASELPYIFDRFYQGQAGKNQKGTGIGLAISKMWVEAHGGEIHAESDGPGKGSRFWFTLPK